MKFGLFLFFPIKKIRKIPGINFLMLLSLLALTLGSNAFAQSKGDRIFDKWKLQCPDSGYCTLYQGVHNPERPKAIYSLQVNRDIKRDKVHLRINLPLGILLPPGVGIKVGSVTKQIPVTVCLRTGCAVIAELDADLEKALNTEDAVEMRVLTSQTAENQLQFSLSGFLVS